MEIVVALRESRTSGGDDGEERALRCEFSAVRLKTTCVRRARMNRNCGSCLATWKVVDWKAVVFYWRLTCHINWGFLKFTRSRMVMSDHGHVMYETVTSHIELAVSQITFVVLQ